MRRLGTLIFDTINRAFWSILWWVSDQIRGMWR